MEKEIFIASDGSHIVLVLTGNITRRSAMDANMEAHKLGRERGISRFLADLRNCRNREDVVDNYEFAYQDLRTSPDLDRFARVAFLVDPSDHSHDFVETVARNNGLDVKIFTDRAEAEAFLREAAGGRGVR